MDLGILEELASEVIRLGADTFEVEYKDRHEEVTALKGSVGVGIARLPSQSPEAKSLRKQLDAVTRRKHRMRLGDCQYELRGRTYESFGEIAYSVEIRRV